MNTVRWTPLRDMAMLHNRFNRFFDDDFYAPSRENDELAMTSWNPVVDIYDNDSNIIIKAELPGLNKKDIVIDLKDRVLTLKGERSFENEAKDENYYKRERCFGKFHRAFTLPVGLKADKIKANFKDGVLKIDIPKPEEEKPKQITIH
ncbi:MAG: Hsp20/alpha crystallin family protein [Deltaproteobacteria bacterium]|nr:Hsp20/alpha crystallin family protein [Deltaproteobacteria bacterium]